LNQYKSFFGKNPGIAHLLGPKHTIYTGNQGVLTKILLPHASFQGS